MLEVLVEVEVVAVDALSDSPDLHSRSVALGVGGVDQGAQHGLVGEERRSIR